MRWVPLEELGGLLGQEVPPDLAESLGRGKGGGGGASLIEKGFVVDTVAYAKGCGWPARRRARRRQRRVARLQDLEDGLRRKKDAAMVMVMVARAGPDGGGDGGAGCDTSPSCGRALRCTTITNNNNNNNKRRDRKQCAPGDASRGQSLEYAGGDGASSTISPPPRLLLCGDYVVPVRGRLIVGATHEPLNLHSEEGEESADSEASEEPDLVFAAEKLEPAAHLLWPPLCAVKPTAATAAVRVNPRRTHLGKLPLAGRIVVGASAGAAHSAATAPTASGDHGEAAAAAAAAAAEAAGTMVVAPCRRLIGC